MSMHTAPVTADAEASSSDSGATPDPVAAGIPAPSSAPDDETRSNQEPVPDDHPAPDEAAPPVISLDPTAGIDADMLARLADAGADLSQTRRIAHFLYVPDEAAATALVADLADTFSAVVWTPTDAQPEWTVVAELRDAAVTAESIAVDDVTFTALAETHGGRYDGWEATV